MLVTQCQTTKRQSSCLKKWKYPTYITNHRDNETTSFYAKITNPETEQPYQWDNLTPSYRKFGNGKKYPVREVLHIIRIRRFDSTNLGPDMSLSQRILKTLKVQRKDNA